jgi:hypothetical protein
VWIINNKSKGNEHFDLSGDLTFKSTIKDVHDYFNHPPTSHSDEYCWERYDNEKYCLHFQFFRGGQGIQQITIMSPDAAP